MVRESEGQGRPLAAPQGLRSDRQRVADVYRPDRRRKAGARLHHQGRYGYAEPDWRDPAKPWTFHPISPNNKYGNFTHGMGVGDVNGDGRLDLLEKNGWWEQPASLAGDPVWRFHAQPMGTGGAQMYAYDVNGDGLNDIITALAAHGSASRGSSSIARAARSGSASTSS